MTHLELVVRPHEALNVGPRKRTAPKQEPEVDEAVLEFGSAGDSIFTAKISRFVEFQVTTEAKEVSRTVDIARVKDKNNPNNYVEIESVKKMQVIDEYNRRVMYNYKPLGPDPNIEIVKSNVVITNE